MNFETTEKGEHIIQSFEASFIRYFEKEDKLQAVVEKDNGEVVFLTISRFESVDDSGNVTTFSIKQHKWKIQFKVESFEINKKPELI